MGMFRYPLTPIGPASEVTLEAIVDTAATCSVVSRETLQQLGVQAIRTLPFELSDGRIVEYDVGASS